MGLTSQISVWGISHFRGDMGQLVIFPNLQEESTEKCQERHLSNFSGRKRG